MHTSNTDQSDQTIEDILEAWFQRFAKDEPDGTKTLVLHETYGWEADEEAKYKLSKKLEQLFELEVDKRKQDRIKKNKSFCGCPMCLHHTAPYEAQLNPPNQPKEEHYDLQNGDEYRIMGEKVTGVNTITVHDLTELEIGDSMEGNDPWSDKEKKNK